MVSIFGFVALLGLSLNRYRWYLLSFLCLFLLVLGINGVSQPFLTSSAKTSNANSGGLKKLGTEEMRDVRAGSILNLVVEEGTDDIPGTNLVSNSNRTFVRIETDARLDIVTGVENAVIGDYPRPNDNGENADIAANALRIEGNNSNSATLVDPYVELAYSNYSDDSNRRLDGLRVGAESITGQMYFDLHVVSGGIDVGTIGGNAEINDARSDCMNTWIGCLGLGWGAGIEYDGSEDLWLSINNRNVGPEHNNAIMYEHQNPYLGNASGDNTDDAPMHTDGRGFWLHTTDGGYANVF